MWKNSMDAGNKRFICKPHLKWKCPPKIALSHSWLVAAGEESEEVKTQKRRERKVPEVVYRRPSHIPSSPSLPWKVQEDDLDESQIPLIPMIPIEECEPPEDSDTSLGGTKVLVRNSHAASQCDTLSQIKSAAIGEPALESGSSAQADVALAAATVITALMKSKESGSSIDTDMLVKIFRDPVTVKKLINEVGAPSSSKTETVKKMNLPKTATPLASSKPLFVEKNNTFNGSLKNSADASSPNPNTAPRKHTDEKRAAVDKGKAYSSYSGQVKHELNLFDKGVPSVPRPNSISSHFTFLSQPDPMVLKSTNLPIMPIGTPLPSLSRLKPDLDEFKWTDNGYGVPAKTIFEPISRPNSFSPGVTIQTPNEGLLLPTRMTIYPLPNERRTDSKLKAVISDSVRPTDSLLMPSPVATSVNSYLFLNQPQHTLELNRPFPNPIQPPSFSTDSSQMSSSVATGVNSYLFSNHPHHTLEMNRTFPNPLQPPPFLPKAGPQLHDKNYYKALVQQHGNVRPDQENSVYFQQQNTKPVSCFDPNGLATKIQRQCFFFNSPEGCKLGFSCPYLHDQPPNVQLGGVMGTHSSKKMKLDGDLFRVHR